MDGATSAATSPRADDTASRYIRKTNGSNSHNHDTGLAMLTPASIATKTKITLQIFAMETAGLDVAGDGGVGAGME